MYHEDGDAFLRNRDGSERAVKDLPWQHVAVMAPDGRIAINTVVPGSDGKQPSYTAPLWLSDLQRSFCHVHFEIDEDFGVYISDLQRWSRAAGWWRGRCQVGPESLLGFA